MYDIRLTELHQRIAYPELCAAGCASCGHYECLMACQAGRCSHTNCPAFRNFIERLRAEEPSMYGHLRLELGADGRLRAEAGDYCEPCPRRELVDPADVAEAFMAARWYGGRGDDDYPDALDSALGGVGDP